MSETVPPYGFYTPKAFAQKLISQAQNMPANWLGRRAALLLRRLVLSKKGMTIIDATVDGMKLRLHVTDNISERKFLFTPQLFDPQERKILNDTLKPGDVFVDIGANAGLYSLIAARHVGISGRVLAIEPHPVMIERMAYNIGLNGFDNTVVIEQAAVSDAMGAVDLFIKAGNLGETSLVNEQGFGRLTAASLPLLNIVNKHNLVRIDAMKIDIEGAEDRALLPFFKAAPVSLHPQIIIIENSRDVWNKDLPGELIAQGYALLVKTRMNLVWKKRAAEPD